MSYDGPNAFGNAIGYAEHYSRSHDAVIHVYDAAGNLIETHEHVATSKNDNGTASIWMYRYFVSGRPDQPAIVPA